MEKTYVRPSSLHEVKVCGGYAKLSALANTDNKFTRSGTLAHLWMDAWATHGKTYANKHWPDMVEQVSMGVEEGEEVFSVETSIILSECQEFAAVYTRDKFNDPDTKFFCEQQLNLTYDNAELRGTADVVIVHKDSVEIVDWKFYKDPSYLKPVAENPQLWAYLCMALKKYKKRKGTASIALIRQRDVWSHDFSEADCIEIRGEVDELVQRAVETYNNFNFGPHCSNCLARSNCHEFKKHSFFLTHDIEPWDESAPTSDDEALRLALALSGLNSRIDTVKRFLNEWVKQFGPISDPASGKEYRFVRRKNKYIKNPRAAIEFLGRRIGKDSLDAAKTDLNSLKKAMIKHGLTPAERAELLASLETNDILMNGGYNFLAWRKK